MTGNESEIEEELTQSMYNQREEGMVHLPYRQEMSFYELVKNGSIKELEDMHFTLIAKGQGSLSEDEIRNIRYHFVVGTAMITRFCIEGGLGKEDGYTMSDLFIRRMDKLSDKEEIEKLHREMVFSFAKKMRDLKKNYGSSRYIRQAIDYVSQNFSKPIKISQIAKNIGISEKYLSTLFKKETGMSLVSYIEQVRLKEACRMLNYTELTYSQIADNLSFSSQSYFIKQFKKRYGLTPMQYRVSNHNLIRSTLELR
ncbi:MAG: helix-turn-helix transcriptional regulator [Treponema sp.]|uniref:AraC family transcriptional regulator n=1 Tax=Treponema sp. TaxID=166 RepID=UPI001B658F45|nr:AraC family transcriptional regulator [Treponema sp.]MBP5402061.1 helix-turn-helix transcriptional regulator [Treponema sp.]MBR5933394.1 helix-turn-helix transcriptional regulator [Treponema sp.]